MALPARAQTGALRSYILVRLEVCAHGSARRAVGAGGEAGPRYARSLARASLPLPARSSVAGARRRSVCRAFAPRLIWSSATSTRPSRTAFGRRTSPISGTWEAGCTSLRSWTATAAGSSVGRWPITCAQSSWSTRSRWPSRAGGRLRGRCITPIRPVHVADLHPALPQRRPGRLDNAAMESFHASLKKVRATMRFFSLPTTRIPQAGSA